MAEDTRLGVVLPELAEQVEEGASLGVGAGVGGLFPLVEATLVTDADALVVPTGGVGADLVDRAATVHLAVAGDVEMIADVGETPRRVRRAQGLDGEVTVVAGGAAMDYQEAYLPIVLIETARYHTPQAVRPSAPATALATAMITLRRIPQTDFLLLDGF